VDERVYADLAELEDGHWWFRGRREVVAALLAHAAMPDAPRTLDAGCGTGRNLELYRALGGVVVGVDPSPAAVAFAQGGPSEVLQAAVEELPFADGEFDLVAATDVLEHVDDDTAALRELRRVTATGGWMLATVPAYPRLWSGHDEALHHRRRYVRRELVQRAAAAGFAPVRATYFNTVLLPAAVVGRRLARSRRPDHERRAPAALRWPLTAEAALIRRGGTLPAGLSIALLARASA
jgi:SAM-dependent methyltransferase